MVSIDTHLPRAGSWTARSAIEAGRNRLERFASIVFGLSIVAGVALLVAAAWLIELARTRRWPVRVFPD